MPTNTTQLVSTSAAGAQGNGPSYTNNLVQGVTADGASVLFLSSATNLTPGYTLAGGLYLKNTLTGAISAVSTDAAGVLPDATIDFAAVDADGGRVVLSTSATNIDPAANTRAERVYVHDAAADTLTLLSPAAYTVTNAATGATEASSTFTSLDQPTISGDGRYIAASYNGEHGVLLFDTATHTATDLVATRSLLAYQPELSQDGSTLVFASQVSPVDGSDTDGEVYAYDLASRSFQLVSATQGANAPSVAANADVLTPTVSNDGSRVAFATLATNLDDRATSGSHIYVKDLTTGRLFLADSTADGSAAANAPVSNPSISGDGTMVVFQSDATNLVAGATDGSTHVYLKNLATGAISILDQTTTGYSSNPYFAPDSTHVVFSSDGSDLTPNDANQAEDVFLTTLGGAAPPPADTAPTLTGVPATESDPGRAAFHPFATAVAADPDAGQTFTVTLIPQDAQASEQIGGVFTGGGFTAANGNVYSFSSTSIAAIQAALDAVSFTPSVDDARIVYSISDGTSSNSYTVEVAASAPSLPTATVALVSTSAAGVEGDASSGLPPALSVSTNAGVVLFGSQADNLAPGANGYGHLYAKTLATGSISVVDASAAGVAGNAFVDEGRISADGRTAVFSSTATNLTATATDGTDHVYVKDLQTGAITSYAGSDIRYPYFDSPPRYADLQDPAISSGGDLAFQAYNPTNVTDRPLIFFFPIPGLGGIPTNITGEGTIGENPSFAASSSVLAFDTNAVLSAADTNGRMDVYTYAYGDDGAPVQTLISVGSNGDSTAPSVSADGTVVAFTSTATNLDARDRDATRDVYVSRNGVISLVDVTAAGVKANAPAAAATLSSDGTRVDFLSAATNLVAGISDGLSHAYQKNLVTGALTLVDATPSGAAPNGAVANAVISPDGSHSVYISTASNLVSGDANGVSDVFVTPTVTGGTTPPPPPANTPPAIGGTQAGQADAAGAPVAPFSGVTVTDPDAGQSETVTVSFAPGNGGFSGAGFTGADGSYTGVFTSAADAQAALRAASFTPAAGRSTTTTLTLTVSDGQASATDSATSVVAAYTAPGGGGGGGGGGTPSLPPGTTPSVQAGLLTEFQNLARALAQGADAQNPASPLHAQFQAEAAVAAQLDAGQLTLAQADAALDHLVDGTTAVAVASYGFFTGATPTALGLDYLVHSGANGTDLNDAYYARFSTENRFINFAVNLATGVGAGASAFSSAYGSLSLADATARAYAAVFGTPVDAVKVSAILNDPVPDGLGGQETRAAYFAQYGGDGPNGQATKAAMVGFLLAQAVHDGSGVYGAATEHYLDALAHGAAPASGSELALHYGPAVSLVGTTPVPDPAVTG